MRPDGSVSPPPLRLSEVVATLSLATDLAMGQPVEFALRSCVLAMRLGEALGFSAAERREVYYQALLRYIGCNAETHVLAALFGDEIALRRAIASVDLSDDVAIGRALLKTVGLNKAGEAWPAIAWAMAKGLALGRSRSAASFAGHCEVAKRLAERLGLGAAVARNLEQLYERWDGKGSPNGLKGEAIAPAVRLTSLAQDAVVLATEQGVDRAFAVLKARRAKAYDPRMVDMVLARASLLDDGLAAPSLWTDAMALDQEAQEAMSETAIDEACLVLADFVDVKTPYTVGHSRAVAALAEAAARRLGLTESDTVTLRRAALVHDFGRVAVPTAVWMKPGPFTSGEWEQVRLHAYQTERLLARSPALARLGSVAGQHHERIDGSGYHRGVGAPTLAPPARILAAAEFYRTKTEARPHRAALSPEHAASALKAEIHGGRIDADAAQAVLAVAGHDASTKRRPQIAGLTARELDVLRLIAKACSTKEIAVRLGISIKTADNHIQGVYGKIGVSTRAGATLYAMEHGLSAD